MVESAKKWFKTMGWKPFTFQINAWQQYLEGKSGLIHTSTGTGKTYAAFMGVLIEALMKVNIKMG